MKLTTLRPMKFLASKIHPPLPPSALETQHLLSLLNSYYKEKLDRPHPLPDSIGSSDSHQDWAQKKLPRSFAKPPKSSIGAFHSHIGRVLRNPLLDPQYSEPQVTSNGEPGDVVNAFERRVAQGTATPEDALTCLNTHLRGPDIPSDKSARREALKKSGLGSKVLEFLWSQDLEYVLSRNDSKSATLGGILIQYLLAEGRQDVLQRWVWSNAEPLTGASLRMKRALLLHTAKGRMKLGFDLEETVTQFLQDMQPREHQVATGRSLSPNNMAFIFRSAGRYVTSVLVEYGYPSISQALYDQWLASVGAWDDTGLFEALLKLHHPQSPDPSFAIRICNLHSGPRHDGLQPAVHRAVLAKLCLETCQYLFDRNMSEHGSKLFCVARGILADLPRGYMGKSVDARSLVDGQSSPKVTSKPDRERTEDEAKHLRMLDALNFG